ncbi:DUF885 family protein [Puniceicoccaceae bacterium K14]|nr:DUF885 family protein [Puniceicoccaceae bacterium K14]
MNLPSLRISYFENIERLQPEEQLVEQKSRFEAVLKRLGSFNREVLSEVGKLEYDLIDYEIRLNLERIEFGLSWYELESVDISADGLRDVPLGNEWYAYFLKRWVDSSVTPEMVYTLGEAEIVRVKSEIRRIQVSSGLNLDEFKDYLQEANFFYNSPEEVQSAFEMAQRGLLKELPKYFPHIEAIGPARIKRNRNRTMAHVPAYYSNALYFTYSDEPFNRRQIYWIYLHEALPGHHYQGELSDELRKSEFQRIFSHPSYFEGWAAYIEDLAVEIHLYDDVYSELGKWEWDLIRSVRLVLDVGLNYYSWSDEKALKFWKKHIEDLDDIGLREIDRMKRWPAQVVTYKYGAKQFMSWKEEAMKRKLSLYRFHELLMNIGPLPLSVLDQYLNETEFFEEIGQIESIASVHKIADVQYYSGKDSHPDKHKLDLCLPVGDPTAPLLLWIHGGAWSTGDRKSQTEIAMRFAERGVGVAAISHRLSQPHTPGNHELTSEVQHPEHIKDVARAFAWLEQLSLK